MPPSKVTATASGVRCTCWPNNSGTDTVAGAGNASIVRLPWISSRAISSAPSNWIEESRSAASVVMAVSTRCSRLTSASTVSASNTSVRYSTIPQMPPGSPLWVQRSVSENDKSIRAVWLSIGSGVARTSPKARSAGSVFC
ncbi:hypothetical protein ATCCBAA256_34530 [Mycobacterium montefiorense]|nr:hypothetical protein ATCCBAA256_34530 [Mycobacterium montefiorense]